MKNNGRRYRKDKLLGEGAYGKVWLGFDTKLQRKVAIKIIRLSIENKKQMKQILNEIAILKGVSSPFVVTYYDLFHDQPTKAVWIIMEFMEGGDLSTLTKKALKIGRYIGEKWIWRCLLQVLLGLKRLHSMKILHRDIKPENLFLDKRRQNVKIGDMNVSKVTRNNTTSTQIGTPLYVAPEVWNCKDFYDDKCDVFSFGCCVHELANLEVPFYGLSQKELIKQITTKRAPRIPEQYSEELQKIIDYSLIKNPRNRPTVKQLLRLDFVQEKLKLFGLLEMNESSLYGFQEIDIFSNVQKELKILKIAMNGKSKPARGGKNNMKKARKENKKRQTLSHLVQKKEAQMRRAKMRGKINAGKVNLHKLPSSNKRIRPQIVFDGNQKNR